MFEQLSNNLKIDWNFDEICTQFKSDIFYEEIPQGIYDDVQGSYFQTFDVGLGISTNFNSYFNKECQHVVDVVSELQEKIRAEVHDRIRKINPLLVLFLEKEILSKDIVLIRVDASIGCGVHVDRRRTKALNIGFKNSNTCTTYFREGSSVENFYNDFSKLKAVTLNDGDAYLVDVAHAHAVNPNFKLPKETIYRYIISCNLGK